MGYAKPNKIIIIEPSPIIVAGLRVFLEERSDFEIVAHYQDLKLLNERIIPCAPDIVIINPFVLDAHDRYYIKNIFSSLPDVKLFALVYSYMEEATLNQYAGYISINDTAKTIVDKFKFVEDEQNSHKEVAGNDLSVREIEILVAVANGLTNKEISSLHNISIHTVISHRKNITKKTGIKTISGLTVYAMLRNLI